MKKYLPLIAVFLLVFIWSGIQSYDYFTWVLEVFPAVIGAGILLFTYKKFPLTYFLYTLILIHAIILFIGGHYTYAEVPLFDFIRDFFGHTRNNYDKVGHFVQGFVPVFIAREIFIRRKVVNGDTWVNIISIAFCIAFSAVYELLEWLVSILSGSAGDSFLGAQGYVWDTQSDMGYAALGAIVGVVLFQGYMIGLFGRFHSESRGVFSFFLQ